jgi:rhamnosyl/mannosyltransferase
VVKTARVYNLSSAPLSPDYYPWLRRLAAQSDLVHAHLPYPPAELGYLAVGQDRPLVLTYHSDIVRQRMLGFFYSPFLRRVVDRAAAIIVATPAHIQSSPFLQPVAAKCRVIEYGIDLVRFAATPALEAQAAALRQEFGSPLLLFVGKLRHYKGLDVLIRALQDVPNARLLVIGNGPLEAAWQQLARATGLQERVIFWGERSDPELVAAYHAADLFVLPSTNRAEAFGIVQIEAMACGTPVICTELHTGTSYVNRDGETGLVVPPNDPPALAAAISRLLGDDATRGRMAAAARARAQTVFAQEVMHDKTLALYTEILRRHAGQA